MKQTYSMITVFASVFISLLSAEEVKKEGEKKGEEVIKKEAVKPYKLDTCMVSGEKLGEMGEPVVFVYQGQEIKLCCKACRKKFDKDSAMYLKKLAESK